MRDVRAGEGLLVDLDLLRASAASLDVLARALDDLDRRTDEARSAWGHDLVREAVREVADDWDDRRRRLVGDVDGLAARTRQCADALADADRALRDELREATSVSGPSGAGAR